jgi:effector-binding domain-containing protein
MMTLPENVERPARPYIYVPFTVRMDEMQKPANEGFPQLFDYLRRHGLQPAGAPFYNYRRINMEDTLDVEAGIPVEAPAAGEGEVRSGTLPGGRFMTVTWHGHPDALITVTGVLIGWSRLTNQPFDQQTQGADDYFACRLELYETEPEIEPDMNKWETRLEFKLRD